VQDKAQNCAFNSVMSFLEITATSADSAVWIQYGHENGGKVEEDAQSCGRDDDNGYCCLLDPHVRAERQAKEK